MERELLVENISYRNRSVKLDNTWMFVSKDFELNDLRKQMIYKFDIGQKLNGEYIVYKIKND